MSKKFLCHNCQTEWVGEKVGFRETCEKCDFDLHCCYNCFFCDASSYNECHEPQAERILDKEKANFCEYFKIKIEKLQDETKPIDPKKTFDDLFK